MMYGFGSMGEAGLFISILWVLVLVDLTLLGIWLWKKISKE